jgi:hypothetical protein
MKSSPDDPANTRSNGPNRVSGTLTGRHGAAPAQDEIAATASGSWSRLRRRRACAAHPGSAHSPTSDSREQGEARVRALRDREAGDPVRDAGTSTSFAPAHGATATASAATPETRSTGPAESTGSQPRATPGHAESAAAASLTAQGHATGGEATAFSTPNADTGEPPTISHASRHNAKLTRNKNTARSYGTAVAAAPKPPPKHRIGISDPFTFARGARTGVRIVRMASERKHIVERRGELAVAVVDQKADRLLALDERLDDVACLLGRSLSCRVRGDSREIHLPG